MSAAIKPAARHLLKRLQFRHPEPCYLVQSARGRWALVVTTMMGTLERSHAVNWPTIQELEGAGLIALGDWVEVPPFGYRQRLDGKSGYPVRLTFQALS